MILPLLANFLAIVLPVWFVVWLLTYAIEPIMGYWPFADVLSGPEYPDRGVISLLVACIIVVFWVSTRSLLERWREERG